MPHATRNGQPAIKTEPGQHSSAAAVPGATRTNGSQASSTDYDVASATMRADQSFYHRGGRSDAPTPSERLGDCEPLLREMRMRPNQTVDSPPALDESSNFHTSFQDIGKKLKACNDTLGELQGLGVSHDVPLPELVLVGDQSAGKSSVMSGLANLDLPRSEGTCTRCPLHIRVSRNSDWSCRVSLSKEYSYRPPLNQSISEKDVTDEDPFFPWRKLQSLQIVEFKTVHDKTEIEDVLRWAQVAILNDDKPHELFVPGSGAITRQTSINQAAEATSAKFSPNVVFLEIKGPELPNLSFYDMPGIFQNPADARDDYLVNVVRNLSMAYIKRESAIIMCSMPMNSDAENSCTFGLARKLGASTRTIGVLTKADLLPEGGNHSQWLEIMKGKSHHTGLGYFITSRPQGKDLDQLKLWEEAMFETSAVDQWPDVFHQFSDRCGVEKLKAFLSQKLGEQFIKSLPHIEHKVKVHLDKINRNLSSLPELPSNVELEIRKSLLKFTEVARIRLDEFVKHLNPLPDRFKTCILEIKPKFILKDKSDHPVYEISDDSDSESAATTVNTPSKRRNMAPPATPSKRQRANTPASNGGSFVKREETESSGALSPAPRRQQNRTKIQPPFEQFVAVGRGFRTLSQVREEILQKTRAGMPDHIPEDVYQSLVLQSMKPWKEPMLVFLKETMTRLSSELRQALNESFDALKKRIVFDESKTHLRSFLEAHHDRAKRDMLQVYSDETRQLLTFNGEAFKQYRQEDHLLLTRFRHKVRMETKGLVPPQPLAEWDRMTEAKRREDTKKREEEMVKIGPDQFEREVEVVSYVRGYYRLAALRFVDSIAQCIICRMIPSIKDEVSFYLDRQLGLMSSPGAGVYERLMEEDPRIASRRESLKMEKVKFERALASIDTLNTGVIESGDGGDAASVVFAGGDVGDSQMDDTATIAEESI